MYLHISMQIYPTSHSPSARLAGLCHPESPHPNDTQAMRPRGHLPHSAQQANNARHKAKLANKITDDLCTTAQASNDAVSQLV